MGKIIVFSFFSQFRCKRSKDSNRENTLKMQWFSGLKFKKYLLFSIFSVYLGGYLETNRLRLYPASSKKGKSIYSNGNVPPALFIEEKSVQLLATPHLSK